ncbi:MAG: hypothetical protein ACRD3Q_10995 [Terriglobales bacterium]
MTASTLVFSGTKDLLGDRSIQERWAHQSFQPLELHIEGQLGDGYLRLSGPHTESWWSSRDGLVPVSRRDLLRIISSKSFIGTRLALSKRSDPATVVAKVPLIDEMSVAQAAGGLGWADPLVSGRWPITIAQRGTAKPRGGSRLD